MDLYGKLVGQLVEDVAFEQGNSGIRLSQGSIGIYTQVDAKALHELFGQSIAEVQEKQGRPNVDVKGRRSHGAILRARRLRNSK
jgi:hypothetical protein